MSKRDTTEVWAESEKIPSGMRFKFALPIRIVDDSTVEIELDSYGEPLINIQFHRKLMENLTGEQMEKIFDAAMLEAIRSSIQVARV